MAKITSTEIGEAIMEKIKENGRCQIPGLGVFSVKAVGERTFRNPRDQQSVVVPAQFGRPQWQSFMASPSAAFRL